SQQVSALQAQVIGEEKLKAAFEEFKQYEDNPVEQHSIAGYRWVIGHGLWLAVMKCSESTKLRQVFAGVVSAGIAKGISEGLKYGLEHGKANLSLEAIEAYDLKAKAKYITALHALKDLKYPIVDQLESLKDVPMDVIMASLHLESNTEDDAP
nr:transposase (putative), gypsy type [Tanacetum cinerariifolium]